MLSEHHLVPDPNSKAGFLSLSRSSLAARTWSLLAAYDSYELPAVLATRHCEFCYTLSLHSSFLFARINYTF